MQIVYKPLRTHLVDENNSDYTACGSKIEASDVKLIADHRKVKQINCIDCNRQLENNLISERDYAVYNSKA